MARRCGCHVAALILAAAALGARPDPAGAQAPAGEAVYTKHCAACHEQTNPRIPARESLQKMPAARIVRALDSGAMMAVGFTLSRDERLAVAAYLGTAEVISGPPPAAFCRSRSFTLSSVPLRSWNGWSPDTNNTRFQPTEVAGLSYADVRRLRLKWAFGFDGDVAAVAQPTVIDGHLFVGSAGGVVHAIRTDSGCLEWTFQANGPVRASMLATPINGRQVLLFGDMTGWFYALDAESGGLRWKVQVEDHDSTRLTGAATAHDGIVYVPVASWEETRSSDPDYGCCTFRGSIVALRVADGRQVWKTYLVGEPKENGRTGRGVPRFGPSGVGVWSTPTLDIARRRLYVTTGDNYSWPATELSDAVVALDLDSGRIVWSKQVTKGDVFNGTCGAPDANCPGELGPDFDFGSPVILVQRDDGRDVLLAGQKSGLVFAFDPDRSGEILWQTRVGKGGTGGGVQWGMAADGQTVYAAVSDVERTRLNSSTDARRFAVDPKAGGGVSALNISDGRRRWFAAPAACAPDAPPGCSPSQPAAVTAIPGVVFAASNDGHVRAHAAVDGSVVWDFDTMRDFDTVNGVKAHGGSIDGPGPVVVGGMVFVSSGYPRNGGVPGNVLLAFALQGPPTTSTASLR
jgi:polyvinyl alcohol dehydrogenase (cytochrome)